MTQTKTRLLKATLATLVGFVSLFASERALLTNSGPLLSTAEARIGRPLTPMSYAGVARRTTRRAIAAGAYGGAVVVAPAPVVVAPVVVAPVVVAPVRPCTQVVDAYGRIIMRCY